MRFYVCTLEFGDTPIAMTVIRAKNNNDCTLQFKETLDLKGNVYIRPSKRNSRSRCRPIFEGTILSPMDIHSIGTSHGPFNLTEVREMVRELDSLYEIRHVNSAYRMFDSKEEEE